MDCNSSRECSFRAMYCKKEWWGRRLGECLVFGLAADGAWIMLQGEDLNPGNVCRCAYYN